MVNLPVQQISKSQRLAPKLYVEPDAKVMQGHFSGQAGLKAIQRMRTLASQPKGIEDLVIDRFNDLPQPSQPAAPGLGPTRFAALMRRANHLGSIGGLPVAMHLLAGKALIGHIDAVSGRAYTGQTQRGLLASGKEGLGQ